MNVNIITVLLEFNNLARPHGFKLTSDITNTQLTFARIQHNAPLLVIDSSGVSVVERCNIYAEVINALVDVVEKLFGGKYIYLISWNDFKKMYWKRIKNDILNYNLFLTHKKTVIAECYQPYTVFLRASKIDHINFAMIKVLGG